MQIYKRKYKEKQSRIYQYSFYIKGTRYRGSCFTKNKREALEYAYYIRDKAKKVQILNYEHPSVESLINYFEVNNPMYIQSLGKSRLSTYNLVTRLLKEYFLDIKYLTKEDLYKFLNYIEIKRKIKKPTISKYIRVLSVILSFCAKFKQIKSNFLLDMDLKEYHKKVYRDRFISKDEYKRLFNVLKKVKAEAKLFDLTPHIYFAINTGLRFQEMQRVKLEHITYNSNTGGTYIYVPLTKTDKPRKIRIYDEKLLQDLKYYQDNNIEHPYNIYDHITNYRFQETYKIIKKRANITNLTWHDLRHTFASYAVQGWFPWQTEAMSLLKLKKYLGHSDIDTTQRYAHLEEE